MQKALPSAGSDVVCAAGTVQQTKQPGVPGSLMTGSGCRSRAQLNRGQLSPFMNKIPGSPSHRFPLTSPATEL